VQAEVAIRWAYRAWEANQSRLRGLCEGATGVADRSVLSKALAAGGSDWMQRTPQGASKFPPDLELGGEEGQNPAALPEEEAILPSTPPLEEDDARLQKIIVGLRGRALHQVRQYAAVLAKMGRDLTPHARPGMIKTLVLAPWPCPRDQGSGPRREQARVSLVVEWTGWIMNKLATIRAHKQKVREEQIVAVQEKLAVLDDGLAAAEACLAEKRELRTRIKTIKQRLPVIKAQLGLLWKTVAGMGRPMSSEMQLMATGNEMTVEEHVATAETHLLYGEGHLQLSDEHLADAEVHLKLVSPGRPGNGRAGGDAPDQDGAPTVAGGAHRGG
jgi:hypothetical protein